MPPEYDYDDSESGGSDTGDSSDDDSSSIDICTLVPAGQEFAAGEASDTDEEDEEDSSSDDGDDDDFTTRMAIGGGRNSRGALWDVGQTIRVRFLGGRPEVRKRVERYARIWEKYANITFRF